VSVLIQNTLINAKMSLPVMAAEAAEDFIFGLDMQFVFDAVIAAIAMFVLFMFLSYVLFNPARDLMKKRQEMIDSNINKAKSDMEEAESLKVEYTGKLANAEKIRCYVSHNTLFLLCNIKCLLA
jgi:F-type H+-transporting ATPase subunit b